MFTVCLATTNFIASNGPIRATETTQQTHTQTHPICAIRFRPPSVTSQHAANHLQCPFIHWWCVRKIRAVHHDIALISYMLNPRRRRRCRPSSHLRQLSAQRWRPSDSHIYIQRHTPAPIMYKLSTRYHVCTHIKSFSPLYQFSVRLFIPYSHCAQYVIVLSVKMRRRRTTHAHRGTYIYKLVYHP